MSFFSCGRWFQVWGKTEEKIYGPDAGTDYKDNQLRFSLLCQVRMPYYFRIQIIYSAVTLLDPWLILEQCMLSAGGT